MVEDWSFLRVSDGANRSDCLPLGLNVGYFALQERSLEDLFALAGAIAGTVPRGDGRGRRTGTWRDPFENEPAFLMAEILAVRLDDQGRQFKQLMARDRLKASLYLQRLAARLSEWIAKLHALEDTRFEEQLKHLDLNIGIADVLSKLVLASPSDLARRAVQVLGSINEAKSDPVSLARLQLRALYDLHSRLLNAIATLQSPALAAFETRLASGMIDPAMGLLLAELRLSMRVGEGLNRNLGRHTDYFYQDILGQHARPATPQRLLLRVAPGVDTVSLPAETSWTLEQGGQTFRYRAQSDLLVQPTEVTGLASIRYDRNPRVMPQSTFQAITGIRADQRDLVSPERARPVFSPDPMAPVDHGLDIHSPMFALAEGERRIELTIRMKRRFRVMTEAGAQLAEVASEGFNTAALADVADATKSETESIGILPLEIEQALLDDPDLVAMFGFTRMKPAIARIGLWVEELRELQAQEETRKKAGRKESGAHQAPEEKPGTSEQPKKQLSLTLLYHAMALKVRNAAQLRLLFARIFQATVVENAPWPNAALRKVLSERTKACLSDDDAAARTVTRAFSLTRADSFQRWLGDAFEFTASTAEGPVRILDALPKPNGSDDGPGVKFNLLLPSTLPPVAPAPGEVAPCLSIRESKDAWISPILFFDAFQLEQIRIRVEVRNMRSVAAFTDDGPVDTGNPFPAFGARPEDGASLMLASSELGNKAVSEISVAVRFAGMPKMQGGFETHYSDYNETLPTPEPKLSLSYLGGDGWKQLTSPDKPVPMMKTDVDGRLIPSRRLKFEVPGGVPAPTRAKADEYRRRKTIRAGAVRLELVGSHGFLATEYTDALATAMRRGALPSLPMMNRKRRMPFEPVLPKVARVALGYVAETTLAVNAPSAAKEGERLVEVGPFGKVEIYPSHLRRDGGLFPGRLADASGRLSDASLFIRLGGARARRRQSIIFAMEESESDRVPVAVGASMWHYMTRQGFRPLPETAIGSDTTDGLLRSGVVSIDLPDDAYDHAPEMPAGTGIWIAVSADKHLDSFPVLRSVQTNGVWVEPLEVNAGTTRPETPAVSGALSDDSVPGARVWRVDRRGAEIGEIVETGVARAGKPAEDRRSYLARVSNRLAHRGRALTPVDIERLVLRTFPDVWKTKCFRTLHRQKPQLDPGQITVAVVPQPASGVSTPDWYPEPRRFDVQTLRKIKDFLKDIGPICADWDVVNPSFERLQVRARVGFHAVGDEGALALRLKRDLIRALSVWTARDPLDGFGWRLNPETLKAKINDLSYVARIVEFSVVHLVRDDHGSHFLADTARRMRNVQDQEGTADPIYGREPWSLPLSWPHHLIEAVGAEVPPRVPGLAGISNLPVGEMLVVQPRQIAGLLQAPEPENDAGPPRSSQFEVNQ